MIRATYILVASTAALCGASPGALAASHQFAGRHSVHVNCGGSGVNSLYCIPQQSVFAFNRVGKSAQCSIQVGFTVEPRIQGLSGHAHLELKGISHEDRGVKRTARPLVGGGQYSHRFKKLRGGEYRLSGWYEGDGTRIASLHRAKRFTLHC
jgi:hypothetical protein